MTLAVIITVITEYMMLAVIITVITEYLAFVEIKSQVLSFIHDSRLDLDLEVSDLRLDLCDLPTSLLHHYHIILCCLQHQHRRPLGSIVICSGLVSGLTWNTSSLTINVPQTDESKAIVSRFLARVSHARWASDQRRSTGARS